MDDTQLDDAELRAAFAGRLGRLLRSAEACGASTLERESTDGVGHVGQRWIARATDAHGLTVLAELGRVAVGVRLVAAGLSWSHDEVVAAGPRDPNDSDASAHDTRAEALDEALDLVASALWGSARALVTTRGGTAESMQIQFGADGRFTTFARVGGPPRGVLQRVAGLWRPSDVVTYRNSVPPPAGVLLDTLGRSPTAPWSGAYSATGAAQAVVVVPVDGVLDLHTFKPKQVKAVVLETIEACKAKGITELRIIHGKGIGNLRRTVHALLERHADVADYELGGHGAGSWGATLVTLTRDR